MIWILSNGALCNISFPYALGKMTLRENSTFESWENRKLHDLQEKNEIQAMGNPERPWPTGEKWNPGHGNPGKVMTYKGKMKSRPWETRKAHDLQEKNEIQVMVEPETAWPTGEKWNPGHGKPGKAMTYRRKIKSRPWKTRKGHDLQEKNEIQAMGNPERPWPTGEKWNPGHGGTGKAMTYRRKMKSRPWWNWKDHDLQEKNEIQIIEKMETAWSGDSACSEWICIK